MGHRPDAIGLFWQDVKSTGRNVIQRVMPDIPYTGWTAPKEFPRLDGAPYLSFDCETKDPELLKFGPGWARGSGNIIGIAVHAYDRAWYFPMRHEVCPEENLDPLHVIAWARDTFANARQPKIGANVMYDIGWLSEDGVDVKGKTYDVQFAEALLEERGDTNLEHLGTKYLGAGKESPVLYQFLSDWYGGKPDAKQRKNFYRCPPSLVGPYAEQDAMLPAQILPLQWARLHEEGLEDVFDMETRLIPLLIAMRRAGVNVDIDRAEQVRDALNVRVKELTRQLSDLCGFPVNVDANENLQKVFNHLRIPMPLDPKSKSPSFTKDTLPLIEHPVAELILQTRKLDKVRSTFIESYILEAHTNGVVHCQFHPLRGDEGGTRSGRFAASNPNYQNVPSRDEEMAPLVRSCFIPKPGHKQWRRYDYDQIEYRGLAHFAVGKGADELRRTYVENPETDYHVNTQTLVTKFTGIEIPRKPIKNFNFGMTFGMGKDKMVRSTMTELRKIGGGFRLNGEELFKAYHEACPFTKATLEHYSNLAQAVGFVSTILGRRSRFNLWESSAYDRSGNERAPALTYELAVRLYGSVKRAMCHKALNRVLQGSAADILKRAMLKLWDSGVLDVVGVPGLTVHDELDYSDEGGHEQEWAYVKHVLENTTPMRIPIIASLDVGPNWGACT